jgi:hypothetical protein
MNKRLVNTIRDMYVTLASRHGYDPAEQWLEREEVILSPAEVIALELELAKIEEQEEDDAAKAAG